MSSKASKLKVWPLRLLDGFLAFYQRLISPLLAPRCRFYPTCSCYARQAFKNHGFFKGAVLSIWRILRCHPWSGHHWHDPVPKRFAWTAIFGYKRTHKEK